MNIYRYIFYMLNWSILISSAAQLHKPLLCFRPVLLDG